jgi:hypothetical protein
MDVGLHLEVAFGKDDFNNALTEALTFLAPAQAMFGADGLTANVDGLLADAQSVVAFDMAFGFGFKVESLIDFFAEDTSASNIGSLFFRIDDMGIFAEATASGLNLDLFSGVGVAGGELHLSVGTRLAAPLELELAADGSLANGISFSGTIKGQLSFEPHGQLSASLPLNADINGVTQELVVILEDGNLFDGKEVLVKVDFDACQVVTLLDNMIGKLGSLTVSAESLIGFPTFSGIDFESVLANGIDAFFPDVSQYVTGALNGEDRHQTHFLLS